MAPARMPLNQSPSRIARPCVLPEDPTLTLPAAAPQSLDLPPGCIANESLDLLGCPPLQQLRVGEDVVNTLKVSADNTNGPCDFVCTIGGLDYIFGCAEGAYGFGCDT